MPSAQDHSRVLLLKILGNSEPTRVRVAKRYYDSITAPQKEYVLLPSTGHDPNVALIDAQYNLLKSRVVPLTK